MQRLLLKNIKTLVGVYDSPPEKVTGKMMRELPVLEDAWLACDEGLIGDFGPMSDFPGISDWKGLEVIDCAGKIVMPCFADSHTHIVYAGNREQEFIDRINGLTYEEIARRGGGILNSVARLRNTSEDELFEQARSRLIEVIRQGTGAIEIKSGYGLDLESELKMLRVIRRLKDLNWIPVKATFLGAHAVPLEFKDNKEGYLQKLVNEMIPEVGKQGLADYIDVFCEKNYFNAADTQLILETGKKYNMTGKVHAEQLSHTGGIRTAIECGARSADHLEFCSDEDITLMLKSDMMPTILPGAALFLGLPLPPARKMIDAGLPVAFASDYNPGSSPSGNMKLMMSLACIQYKLNPEEAINAVTINSAYAMGLQTEVGTITRGKRANVILTNEISSYGFLAYAYGSQLINEVIIGGVPFRQ